MSFNLQKLVRPHLLSLKPYSSARDEYKGTSGIFLDANENSFGSSTSTGNYSRYPDPLQLKVKESLSHVKNIPVENIFLGNGSDEPIDLLFRIFCEPQQDNFIQTPPTYGMYQVCADINHIETINIPLTPSFQLQPKDILKAVNKNTKLIFICSPNNPSGNNLNRNDIIEILENFNGLVVVDEAYIDFSEERSFISELDKFPNLVVLQTFSKAWGLANLRIGMAFASKEIMLIMNKVKYPYNINGLTQNLALDALQNVNKKGEYVRLILEERSYLQDKLKAISGVSTIFPSDSNFILVRFEHANELFDFLISNEIIARSRTKVTLCDNCIRITVGTRDENEQLIKKIKEFYK